MNNLPRPCLTCGTPTRNGSRCAAHTTTGTTARGYGAEHQAKRRRVAQLVDSGHATCSRCGQPIQPGKAWDLEHLENRTGYRGPSHAKCNRANGESP
jgi:hypothetical protein